MKPSLFIDGVLCACLVTASGLLLVRVILGPGF